MVSQVAVTKSTEEFAKVKAGMLTSDSLPYEFVWWILLGLCVLITLSVLATWIRKKRRGGLFFQGWITIIDPHHIAAIFKRAAARQADCTLEIFDHRHTAVYRGQAYEADPKNQHILLELSQLPDVDMHFEDLPAHVHLNFRPAPKEIMEHYQFSSHTLGIDLQREKSWRVARVALAWPKSVISGQRRDFLRVTPVGEHAIKAALKAVPEEMPDSPDNVPMETEASILDISVGGLQLSVSGILALPENQPLLVTLDLPLSGLEAGLEAGLKNPRLHLLLNILVRDVVAPSAAAGQSAPDTRTIIRGNFTGRYRYHPEAAIWTQEGFSEAAFQDLTHWIHAYQRYQLKREKGLMSFAVDRVNIYPSVPPERPPLKGDDNEGFERKPPTSKKPEQP